MLGLQEKTNTFIFLIKLYAFYMRPIVKVAPDVLSDWVSTTISTFICVAIGVLCARVSPTVSTFVGVAIDVFL